MRLLKSPHLMGARFSLTYLGSYSSVCFLYFIVYTDQFDIILEEEYQSMNAKR